jgi:DNA-binding GntR family transcriptional regulator
VRPAAVATDTGAAYQALRDEILRTRLKPGQALNEAELMKQFAIGRTPLRDALHRLAHEGLVEIWPRRGTFVSQVTVSDLQQVFEFRAAIEPVLAQFVVVRCTPAGLANFRALARRARSSHSDGSDVSLDTDFHALLLEVAGNRYLADAYGRLLDASLRLHYLTECSMESQQQQIATLDAVAGSIERRDAAELTRILVNHDAEFRDRVSRALFVVRPFPDDALRNLARIDERPAAATRTGRRSPRAPAR